jgi:ribonuclease P protein component
VFQQGRHNSGRLIAVRSAPNEVGISRFAFSVSKRVGKAVVRNKVRRRLREIVRSQPLVEGFDVVIAARPQAAQTDFWALKAEVDLLMKRARLLNPAAPTARESLDS